ncbi:MAG: CDP-diacylglycerol--glycerol-3-phosphate 3-phosphatidyltransferase [Clostridiaceae bacterium]|nr:CDP-diacylglycerol--glycerol-3-phosphate 3-phosphatidyltransferase [Clostridiales bacterium]MDD2441666.1 CDP-diacylglycerol--glycerol-3-phosphate 3-phosphatidyltransferase [Eubacteriales bacterium]MDD4138949.1 CDP-diacylglycerol--glycerol-3-phosphate 3-phosphatidyltransferase [Eubacteriales bacterium]MDD4745045.1 CDP-diacylglycerol--glycerol-3-phosphate 3-phosphatidyltransferase [Eubacteriales bacterium]NLB44809.1 CDP-diacylglycerol--glycerol-3-phosphate 3-phosphatidyltransferase [Clostridia
MNLPNRLTVLRILLIPLILIFLLPMPDRPFWLGWNDFLLTTGRLIAFVLFGLASITDLADGHIARKRNLVTTLGKFLDPIADKMLVVSALIALVQLGRVHALVTIVVIIREFIITGVRLIAAEHGKVIPAGNLGKAKTVSQVIAILVILIEPFILMVTGSWFRTVGDSILFISVLLTVLSGLQYLLANRSMIRG